MVIINSASLLSFVRQNSAKYFAALPSLRKNPSDNDYPLACGPRTTQVRIPLHPHIAAKPGRRSLRTRTFAENLQCVPGPPGLIQYRKMKNVGKGERTRREIMRKETPLFHQKGCEGAALFEYRYRLRRR